MGLLSRKDLKFEYSWTHTSEDDPQITGKPDSSELNRHEGYEVLYFINSFAKKHSLKEKNSGLKAEKMIREDLPGSTRSRSNVTKWLEDNWKNYDY